MCPVVIAKQVADSIADVLAKPGTHWGFQVLSGVSQALLQRLPVLIDSVCPCMYSAPR